TLKQRYLFTCCGAFELLRFHALQPFFLSCCGQGHTYLQSIFRATNSLTIYPK
ncbi:hypothetical protein SERLA73DRAFT_184138, partial [Serpula lacrymans var. lacrymans S7.3]